MYKKQVTMSQNRINAITNTITAETVKFLNFYIHWSEISQIVFVVYLQEKKLWEKTS